MIHTPDFKLKCLDKSNNNKSGKIGCAWKNDDGTLTLLLDAGCCIVYNPSLVYTLFPLYEKDILDKQAQ